MLRSPFLAALAAAGAANAYWLMGINNALTIERLDPIVNPGAISAHAHYIVGGSGFRDKTDTEAMRKSMCTSIPIPEDHSNYWVPQLYFHWKNGSVSSVGGGMVIYYLFDANGKITPFPDNLRMISGDPQLRSYDPNSKAQQAITFLCLDFNGVTTRHNGLPSGNCKSGIRSQVNFPMCWDGKNSDSPDHKSHVAFPSGGPDSGTCNDPNYPFTIPRIFIEVYWDSGSWYDKVSSAMNPEQPFVLANGDTTGYSYHGDFMMGWDRAALTRAIAKDGCTCDIYGGMDCCVAKGIFGKHSDHCRTTPTFNEAVTGTLPKLPGNNPITGQGATVASPPIDTSPERFDQVYEYVGDVPPKSGTVVPGSGGKTPPPAEPQPYPGTPKPSDPAQPKPSDPTKPSASAIPPNAPVEPQPSAGTPKPSQILIPKPSDPVKPSASAVPTPPTPPPTKPSPIEHGGSCGPKIARRTHRRRSSSNQF